MCFKFLIYLYVILLKLELEIIFNLTFYIVNKLFPKMFRLYCQNIICKGLAFKVLNLSKENTNYELLNWIFIFLLTY